MFHGFQILLDRLNHRKKFRSNDKRFGAANLGGIQDIRTHKPKIKGNDHRTDLDNTIIGDQPFERIVLQMHDKVAVFDSHFFC